MAGIRSAVLGARRVRSTLMTAGLLTAASLVGVTPPAHGAEGVVGTFTWRSGWVIDGQRYPGAFVSEATLTPSDPSVATTQVPDRVVATQPIFSPAQLDRSLPVVDGATYAARFVEGPPISSGFSAPGAVLTFDAATFPVGGVVDLAIRTRPVTVTVVDSAGAPVVDAQLIVPDASSPFSAAEGSLDGTLSATYNMFLGATGVVSNHVFVADQAAAAGIVRFQNGVTIPVTLPGITATTTDITITVPDFATSETTWQTGWRVNGADVSPAALSVGLTPHDPTLPTVNASANDASVSLPVIDGATYTATSDVPSSSTVGSVNPGIVTSYPDLSIDAAAGKQEIIDAASVDFTVLDSNGQPAHLARVTLADTTVPVEDSTEVVIGSRVLRGVGDSSLTTDASGRTRSAILPTGSGPRTGRVYLSDGSSFPFDVPDLTGPIALVLGAPVPSVVTWLTGWTLNGVAYPSADASLIVSEPGGIVVARSMPAASTQVNLSVAPGIGYRIQVSPGTPAGVPSGGSPSIATFLDAVSLTAGSTLDGRVQGAALVMNVVDETGQALAGSLRIRSDRPFTDATGSRLGTRRVELFISAGQPATLLPTGFGALDATFVSNGLRYPFVIPNLTRDTTLKLILRSSGRIDVVDDSPNTDGDNVVDADESGAPNNGDGNLDGTPDAEQVNVTSIPSSSGAYVTIAAPAGAALSEVAVVDPRSYTPPTGFTLPNGLTHFRASGLAVGDDQIFSIHAGSTTGVVGYAKLIDGTWNLLPSDRVTIHPDRVEIRLTDGGIGDDDGIANGEIVDPGGLVTDTTPPAITIAGLTNGATYTLGAVPAASCAATDALSGVDGACSLSGGTPSGVGRFTYVATASDRAGNMTTVRGEYRVVYRFDGFLPPINDVTLTPGVSTSVFKVGSTIRVRFQLKRADGAIVTPTTAPQWIVPAKGGLIGSAVDETTFFSSSTTSGSSFSPTRDRWQFNWNIRDVEAGHLYRIGVLLDDGNTYYVTVGLR